MLKKTKTEPYRDNSYLCSHIDIEDGRLVSLQLQTKKIPISSNNTIQAYMDLKRLKIKQLE